jgi:hypothetical protein
VANHFTSKGDCPAAGGEDSDTQDGQGCWNPARVEQAQALEGLVRDTVVPGAEDPDVLIVGDLNSYAQEDPVVALREAGYTDLVRTSVGARAYSYASDGQRGYLDTPWPPGRCGGRSQGLRYRGAPIGEGHEDQSRGRRCVAPRRRPRFDPRTARR